MNSSTGKGKVISLNFAKTPAYDAAAEKERNYVGARIKEARGSQKMSATDLSKRLAQYGVEITSTGINKWELGRSVPSAYQLIAIAHALGLEDDLQYFIGGRADLNSEGQKKLHDYKADLIASGRYKPTEPKAKIRYIEKLVSYLPVSAGTGAFLDEENFEKVRFPENAVPKDADFGVYVSGDSMEPVYHDGQIVWVQQTESLNLGEVGIFICDGCGYIKVYDEQEPSESNKEDFIDSYGNLHPQAVMISYNEEYSPIVVAPSSTLQIVGRVLT